jgi:hypothetical protein
VANAALEGVEERRKREVVEEGGPEEAAAGEAFGLDEGAVAPVDDAGVVEFEEAVPSDEPVETVER